ncbi:MAG TPA: flagellar basal body rod protein FlgC [Thermotogota bacterium]|nr:flagellar basal body rod protein FlgC [Thermotogota bacterium]HPJ89183.1 flagellar basal body rod protein FlgC [Thermotogota bacterium]HPR95654.1 flagellar basal body rod protein FlgC [Thermotogota bacterium]
MLDIFNTMNVSASGMTANRLRLDVIADNIANAETTRTDEGGPYRRKTVAFSEILKQQMSFAGEIEPSTASFGGVEVSEIVEDQRPFKMVYDPAHPDANEEGYVQMPNVNVLREMVDLINAQRAYEANVSSINATKAFASAALGIGRG